MFLVVQSKLVTWNSLSWKVVTCGNSSLGTVWVGKLWLVKVCDPDCQKHVSSQLLGFQHPQNSKLLNQRMERSNQEQEHLRHQLRLTRSAFETWLFFQEATFQDPQRSKRWEAGLPFRVECKNNPKKKQTTFPSLHTTFARQVPKPSEPRESCAEQLNSPSGIAKFCACQQIASWRFEPRTSQPR